jgi:hypothetical protein
MTTQPVDWKLRLSREAIARAALLSPQTVGRTIQRLADLGLITIHRRHKSDSVFERVRLFHPASHAARNAFASRLACSNSGVSAPGGDDEIL